MGKARKLILNNMIQYLQTAFLLILLTLTTGKKTYSQEMQPISAADIPQIQPSKKEKKSTQLFNKDGNPDIIWRNKVNGINVIWFMNGDGSNSLPS
jgi:hypothetical protein